MNTSSLISLIEAIEPNLYNIYPIIWIGEHHGIIENYKIYKELLPYLFTHGYTRILWEMPGNFPSLSEAEHADGRVSANSKDFYYWLLQHKELSIEFIDPQISKDDNHELIEQKLAEVVLSKAENYRSIVITGNFHSQNKQIIDPDDLSILPAAGIVEQTIKPILMIGIKYAGGTFFNFGIKELVAGYASFDTKNLEYGIVTQNKDPLRGERILIHAGIAHNVL